MNYDVIGFLSGILVNVSVIPYALRTYQGAIKPNLTSWSLWTVIGLALLLTYRSSGAMANVWPAVFGFVNPCIVTALVIWRRGRWTKPNAVERACLVTGLASLAMWLGMRERKDLAQYALYVAILADACAAVPTIVFVWRHPEDDRPCAWGLFAVGYGAGVFAITEHTFANYALPVYMFGASFAITALLASYRIRARRPLKEWV